MSPLRQHPKVSCLEGHVEAPPDHKVPLSSRKKLWLMVWKIMVLLDTALMCSKRCKSIQFCKGNKRFQEYKIKWQPRKLFVIFQVFSDNERATGARHIKSIMEINNKHIYMFCTKYCLWVKKRDGNNTNSEAICDKFNICSMCLTSTFFTERGPAWGMGVPQAS